MKYPTFFIAAFITAFCILAFCVSVSAQRYCPKNFEERLQQDYLRQDGIDRRTYFTNTESNALESDLVLNVLKEIPVSKLALQLKKLEKVPGSDPAWKTLYYDCCKERRRIRLQLIRQTYPVLIYTKHQVLGGSHYAYTEAPSDAQFPERRDMLGGKLVALEINADGTTNETLLYEAPRNGNLRDPDVSYDASEIVFSMRSDLLKDDYHLYKLQYQPEKEQTKSERPLTQLTFGPGFADVEPCFLPDGNILFNSTRCMQIVDCWWTDVTNLYVIDDEGRFMRRYGFDQVHTNYPKVLADGRVTFTRWDYNDRGQIFPQGLFVMNYDGTAKTEYYGNNSFFPTTILHAREIPNSAKLVAVASGHHNDQRGKLIVIDRSKGTQENEGVQLVAPIRETKAEHIDSYGQDGEQFQYPLPIDEENFIVTYTPDGFHGKDYDIPFGIYYMDIHNKKRELLAWDPAVSCAQTVPLKQRSVPMQRTSQVDYIQKTGTYYVQDVYEGPGLAGVERGTIKELRVVALEFRAAGIEKNGNGGPAGGALVSTPIACDNGSWDVKRVLGTVPVEEDGSAYFEVPARTPVYFQLLNQRGETVQTMRSWSVLQPGEMFSCVGCHEPKGATRNNPQSRGGAMRTLALRRAPKKPDSKGLTPDSSGFSFSKTIQSILDHRCVSCHSGGTNTDGSPAAFSLLGNQFVPPQERSINGRGNKRVNMAGRRFSESYIYLTQGGRQNEFVNWLNVQLGPPMVPPNSAGAVKSKLLTMFEDGNRSEVHKDVRLSDKERRQFAMWIDLLVPFNGSYTEDTDWTAEQRAEYAYNQMKQDKMAAIEAENIEKYIAYQDGTAEQTEIDSVTDFTQFQDGGIEFKRQFIENYLQCSKNLPIAGKKSGAENVYRNLALNQGNVSGDSFLRKLFRGTVPHLTSEGFSDGLVSYPYVFSNSEYCDGTPMPWFEAKNVIDGKRDNKGHGEQFPSWGPHKRTDLKLTIELGRTVEIDKVVVWLRADFPHDSVWKTGKIVFSDGSELALTFEKTAEPQTFTFSKRKISSLTFTDLVQEGAPNWAGMTEVEVWGTDVE